MYRQLVTGNRVRIKSFAVDQATLLSTNSQSRISTWGQVQGSEMGESEVEGIEVENWEMEDSNLGESETGENDTEESDHFEDCN